MTQAYGPECTSTVFYECRGRGCAIELRSFSKNAGFTGPAPLTTVVPKDMVCGGVSLHSLWARRHGTKYNGAPYIVQRAGEAVYSEEGKAQIRSMVDRYMKNARYILEGLKSAGYEVYGGVNSPYVWMKTPGQMGAGSFLIICWNGRMWSRTESRVRAERGRVFQADGVWVV